MAAEGVEGKSRDVHYDLLIDRLSYLEHIKSVQEEMVKIIRVYTSNEAFTLDRCLQEIVNFIVKRFDFYMVTMLLVDEASGELVLRVCAGEEMRNAEVLGLRIPLGQGLTGTCAKEGETIVVNDVSRDSRFIRGCLAETRSELCVPIKIKHRIVGVLDLQDKAKGRFKRDLIQLGEEIALNVGFVLETKQLYDHLRRHTEDLEKKVEEKVEELKKSEERYRAIVENATDPIFIMDPQGRLTWANRATGNVLGFPREELIGLNITRFVKKGHVHKVYTTLRTALAGGETHSLQIEMITKSGEERTVEFACAPIREAGRPTGVEVTLRDITDRVVIEKLKKNYMKSLEEAVVERTSEIKETQRAAILAIAALAESIDEDTGNHLQRIRQYCKVLAEDLRLHSKYGDSITEEYVEMIYDLSPLHDLGKVGIRDYILQKPSRLTPEEYEKMKDHANIGAHALRTAGEMIHRESIFSIGEMIARFHHEKWDGTGYPAVPINGEVRPLRGQEIPLCARIVALADVYDALTSRRPYKPPFPHEQARQTILEMSGRHFDPEVVQAFLRREADFINIRTQYPDQPPGEGRPFELHTGGRP